MKRPFLTFLFILFSSAVLFAQYQYHETRISHNTSAEYVISPDGNWAVKGRYYASVEGVYSAGIVDIYKRSADTWQLFQSIPSPNPRGNGKFGFKIKLTNSMLVVGSMGYYYGDALYTYIFNTQNTRTWDLVKTMNNLQFTSIDLYESPQGTIRILAVGSNTYYSDYVNVYHWSNGTNDWVQEGSLTKTDSHSFGYKVAVTANFLLVSDLREDHYAEANGAVYIYHYSQSTGWGQVDSLYSPNPYAEERFGSSIALNDQYIVVGNFPTNGDSTYYAYLYDLGNNGEATFIQALQSFDNPTSSAFGYSVSLKGSKLLVGAPYEDHSDEGALETNTGSAFLYDIDNFRAYLVQEIYQPVLDNQSSNFGRRVILSNDFLSVVDYYNGNNFYIYSGFGENIILSAGSIDVTPELADTAFVDIFIHLPDGEAIHSAELPIHLNLAPAGGTIVGFKTEGTLVGENNWISEFHRVDVNEFNTAFSGSDPIYGYGKFITLKILMNPGIYNNTYTIDFRTSYGANPILFDDGSGYTVSTLPGYMKVKHALAGDVDLNGTVQAFDASYILQYLANQISLDDVQSWNADVSANDTISAFDASLILMYRVGSIDILPYTDPLPAAGDILMEDKEIAPNQILTLPIDINNGSNIYSFESKINFDSEVLKYEGFEASEDLSNYMIEVKEGIGVLKIIGASTSPEISEGSFFNLKFSLIEELTEGETTVEMTELRLNENPVIKNSGSSLLSIVSVTDVESEGSNIPKTFSLKQNYPNPFNPTTVISYELPEVSNVTLVIYNNLGQNVKTLVKASQPAGTYNYNWDASSLSSGIYFVKIVAQGNKTGKNFLDVRKMMLLK